MLDTSLTDKLANLSPGQRAKLRSQLQRPPGARTPQGIRRRSQAESLPLSYAQQRLWFLQQLESESWAYHTPITLRLRGPLNFAALQQAFTTIVERHESLRTRFVVIDGMPHQVTTAPQAFDLPLLDLSEHHLSEHPTPEIIRRSPLAQAAQLPFDLTTDLMLRATLLRLNETEHILQIILHHIATDGWSMGIFMGELHTLYQAYVRQQPNPLPELTIQYADFTAWQRQWLQGEVLETQLEYWRRQLAGSPSRLDLPTDYSRPPHVSYQGATVHFPLSPALVAGLKQLNQQTGSTMFMTLLAALNILLYRYTQQDDIVVGSPIANRNRMEIEGLIGCFANTLALRTDLSGNPSFLTLVQRVYGMALNAYTHQDIPFEKLVEELRPVRDQSYSPIFQVMFALQNTPSVEPRLADLQVQMETVDESTAKFDLTLSMRPVGNGLEGYFEYRTDLFEAATIQRMIGHFETLLTAIVANPDMPIRQLPLLTATEQHQILVEWNHPRTDYPQDQCVHQRFEAQVDQTPTAIAIVCEGHTLTYGALNQQANQLAHQLQSIGVRPETLIGVFLDRSIEAVVALLGILKAGGTYVPIAPTDPPERIATILTETQMPVIITFANLRAKLPVSSAQIVCIDQDLNPTTTSELLPNPDSGVLSSHLAYMIYTSGSTGQPKGVMIEHQAIMCHCDGIIEHYQITQRDRVLQFAAFSFDASLEQLLPPLMVGAMIVLRGNGIWSLSELQEQIEQTQLTIVDIPPAYCHQWLTALSQQSPWRSASLRLIICGGDVLPLETIQLWAQAPLDGVKLLNAYGPTEATITATTYEVSAHVADARSSLPIGRPLAGRSIYILDQHRNLMPVGMPGELYIGGMGLARGYYHQSELTQAKFVPNPLIADVTARLYRTGDLARYLPDGNIEFLGRMDSQVKIRGFRIELGEIETALMQHPAVQQAIVSTRAGQARDQSLTAYIIATDGFPTTSELRRSLQSRLPDYMIPADFVRLATFPLTPNGKIDYRALPQPSSADIQPSATYVAPRNHIEQQLADIWAEVLKLEQVGIHDNFFDLGGHSLLATQVSTCIHARCQRAIPLRYLFEAPTIAQLGELLDHRSQSETSSQIIPRRFQTTPSQLSFAQQRLWFLHQLDPQNPAYHLSTTLRLNGTLNIIALQQALTMMIQRHESLRTTYVLTDDVPIQFIAEPVAFYLPQYDLHTHPADRVVEMLESILQQELAKPFDLTSDLMFRGVLIRLNANESVLQLVMHHIATDGWSMDIFSRELGQVYQAYVSGQSIPLTTLPIQYTDFATWQRQWMTGDILAAQLDYWREQLLGAPTLLALPTDYARPAQLSYRGARSVFHLSPSLTKKIKQLSQENGVTLFMTLMAALNTLLYRYTQQDDIVVGSPIASRNRVEIEGLIGCFANTLALRTDLSGNPSFLTLVQRVYEMALNAYTHQDIPFEKLVEELRPVRDQSYSPIFQVMFALQNTPSVEQRLADLQVQTEMVDSSTAKFDLTLSMRTVGNGLEGYFEYRTDLFAAKTIQRMIGHFETLLTAIVADPDAPIRQLPLLTATEQHQIFVEWDRPRTDYPQDQCIHQRFEAQVEQTPTAIAIQATDQTLTYAILEQRANQLAHYLQQRGIGPNQRVGICLERNSWLVVGLLGVLKTGAAYVPLDPSFPIDRLNMMVEDSQISLLISQSTIARSFGHNLPHLDLDLDWPKIANQATTSLTPILPLDPTAIAYVIYTSGSTGRPKGVEVTHRGVVNFLTAMQQTPGISAQDVLLSVTTLSFDIAVLELFLPLTVGAKVVIAERSTAIDGVQLRHLLEQSGATIMQATPATWRLLLAANWQGNPHLKLLCGGEALSLDIAKALTQRSGSLWNLYGPTETTIWSLLEEIPRDPMEITIGYPIANTQTYVVNEALQPVPIGIPGELLIGGDGVAQGYWQRPDLTTERFIANPFSAQPTTADRLYRTGDLVRYQADGRLEFLGRIDQQIKLRGFRIELGEIETLLIQHPSIKAAVVVVKSTEDGDCLVAYLIPAVTSMATNLDHVALRQFLRQKLPQYMLPTHLVMLDQFPLTPNGKIDHRALPQPSPADIQSVAIYVAPRNHLEQQLADIWAEVLKLAQIGIHDNFFEIGGHSLLVIKIVSQMERKMRQSIPVNQMFQTPTIASMAQTLTHRSIEPSSGCVVLLKPGRQDAPLFLVHAVGTSILFYQPLAQLLQSDRAIYVIQPALLHDPQLPIENLETLAQYYLQQIKQIQPQGPYYLGGASFGGCVVYEMAYQLEAAGEAVGRLILFDCSAPGGRQRRSGSSKYQAYWQTLREIGPRYIGTRIRHRLTYERWKFERRRLKAQIHVHAMIGHPIGTELQAEIIYQRHVALLDDYTTKPYNGNLVVIWAEGEKDGIDLVEPDLGWRKYVSGKIKTYPIPGGHMSIFEPPYVQALASCLDAILNLL